MVRGDGIGGEGIVITPHGGQYDSVVIWMHGLGDTAMGWAPAMPGLGLAQTKFVLPTATARPISINGGMPMPGWFDIYGLDADSPEDEEGCVPSLDSCSQHKRLLSTSTVLTSYGCSKRS